MNAHLDHTPIRDAVGKRVGQILHSHWGVSTLGDLAYEYADRGETEFVFQLGELPGFGDAAYGSVTAALEAVGIDLRGALQKRRIPYVRPA